MELILNNKNLAGSGINIMDMITEIKIICSNAGIAILDPNQQYFLADYFQS